jgi:glutamate N-acetyltransferase/amino-acid N-acetyltransferase
LRPVVCCADIPWLRLRLQHPEHRGVRVAHKGARDPDYDEAAVSAAMNKPEITLKVALGLGEGRDRVLTCDHTKEYVAINDDYRS